MSDWINQFTSSYASSIAYGITVFILSLLVQPVSSLFSNWIKQFTEARTSKQNKNLVLPTEQETARFSVKRKVTEGEMIGAIEFLKHDIEQLSKDNSKPNVPGEKIIAHFDKYNRIYQYALGGLVFINIILALLKVGLLQIIVQSIITIITLWMIIAIATSFLRLMMYARKENSRINKIKSQIRDAINIIAPNIEYTYGELGELLKTAHETDLMKLQSELSDIGLSFTLEDMKFAQFLSTAPAEKLLPIGKRIVSTHDQFNDLPLEKKDELARIIVESVRLYPVRLNKSK